eukprot:CAMPEP_0168808550 /NCGR_PEP_ID=MMETSP0726-20121227/2628_1 /TAXON_ID=265536 /ORGANISM="Amphiprora sp., Strain CCMP467" /LENGTH=247 /DNA_ID=CAMNT_0008860507 /DNA_START=276 /DNA_END=1019 /DNA_ORIENTATION=-
MFEESSGWNLSKFGDLAEDWKYWSPQEALSRQAEAKGCQTALPGGIESAAAEGESILLGATTQKATTTKFNGACNYCGKKGHKAAECWSNPKSHKYKGGRGSSIGAGRGRAHWMFWNPPEVFAQAEADGYHTVLIGIKPASADSETLLDPVTQKTTTTKFKGTCNYCGKKGHKAADCWSNLNSPKYKGEGNSFGASGRFKGKCNYCNKMGHKLADCWKKAADDDFVSHLHTTPKHKLQVPNSFPLVQ